jgi:tetratricopeptide (TPR) repeat protein/predicted DNA-binding antitoxin AbrB/MazE fold protein
MKNILITLVILGLCAYTCAESKTEIAVKEGIVKTSTDKGDSLIRPGQKAVLQEGKEPSISLNNKMVAKLLQMNQQIEEERAKNKNRIDNMFAISFSIESDSLVKFGIIMDLTNRTQTPQKVLGFGPSSAIEDISFYTLEGVPLRHRAERVDELRNYYYIYFDTPIAPQSQVKILTVQEVNDTMPDFNKYQDLVIKKENGLWRLWNQNDTPYCLNYVHHVLPKTAIFVKSDPPAETVEEQDGRVAVTIRKYTGKDAHSPFFTYFLWPEKDGTSLKGIPWTNAGQEAVNIYELFLQEDIQSPALWGELAVKLVGGGFYEQAHDAFERCYNGHESAVWDYTALTWQGHLYDIWGQRQEAIEKYQQALKIKPNSNMRHDQWGIILTRQWLKKRLLESFTEDMLAISENKKALIERFKKLPWKNGGKATLELYQSVIENETELASEWVLIGIKLIGAGYFDEAMDCFQRAEVSGSTHSYLFATIIWQGHLLDIKGEREKAIEKYYQALEMNDDEIGQMRHDQWGIVLTKDWVRQRLESPFTIEMLE